MPTPVETDNGRGRTTPATPRVDPIEVVRSFVTAVEEHDLDRALALVADDIEYVNVTLPAVRGRDSIDRIFRPALERWHCGFRVHYHAIAASDGIVLTERTDECIAGPLKARISAYGRAEVVDGKITVWRDAFDWADALIGVGRGLAGILWPRLNRPWPADR